MSAAVRAEIAAAASTVAGVVCSPYYTTSRQAGAAMVRLARTEWPNRLGGLDTWQVWVVLPGDVAQAEKRADELVPALWDALGDVLSVRRAEPQQFVFEGGQSVPGLLVEGTRESE